ncbi:MAG: zinc ribbon domain-containing protein [Candidatus Methanofastidiosia archaeon]|jgi:ribosomal protein L40E
MNFRIKKVLCKNCGAENYPDAPFCIKCGGSLISEPKPKTPAMAFFLLATVLAAIQFIDGVSEDSVSSLWSLVYLVGFLIAMWMAMKGLSSTGEIIVNDQGPMSENGNQKL